MAEAIGQMFKAAFKKYYHGRKMPVHDKSKFRRGGNLVLEI